MKTKKTNLRREKFVRYYLRSGNAADAARRAGYSPRSARQQGRVLLTKTDIQAAIAQARAQTQTSALLDLVEAKQILSRIARATIGNFLTPQGEIDPAKIRHSAQEVAEYELLAKGSRRRLKLRDPISAIERLAKLSGWDAPERHQFEGAVLVIE